MKTLHFAAIMAVSLALIGSIAYSPQVAFTHHMGDSSGHPKLNSSAQHTVNINPFERILTLTFDTPIVKEEIDFSKILVYEFGTERFVKLTGAEVESQSGNTIKIKMTSSQARTISNFDTKDYEIPDPNSRHRAIIVSDISIEIQSGAVLNTTGTYLNALGALSQGTLRVQNIGQQYTVEEGERKIRSLESENSSLKSQVASKDARIKELESDIVQCEIQSRVQSQALATAQAQAQALAQDSGQQQPQIIAQHSEQQQAEPTPIVPDAEPPVPEPEPVPTPTADPTLVESVKALAAQTHHGEQHVDRWNRVLAAFGVLDHNNPMTAAEAQANTQKYSSPLWVQIAETLRAFEAAQ